jgi:hypothetical protein
MNTLDVYSDGNHIRGLGVTYFDGQKAYSKELFKSIPFHGSKD